MAGKIVGGGDISQGQFAEIMDQVLAEFGFGQVTAVDQDVAGFIEGIGPHRDIHLVVEQALLIQR